MLQVSTDFPPAKPLPCLNTSIKKIFYWLIAGEANCHVEHFGVIKLCNVPENIPLKCASQTHPGQLRHTAVTGRSLSDEKRRN